jgi:hypothetical protein
MDLTKLKSLSNNEQIEYASKIIDERNALDGEYYRVFNDSYNIKFAITRRRSLNWIAFLYATQAFPVYKNKKLTVSVSNTDIFNGELVSHDDYDNIEECRIEWNGYVSVLHDGQLHLKPIKQDATVNGTIIYNTVPTDKFGIPSTFTFNGYIPIGDCVYPGFVVFS